MAEAQRAAPITAPSERILLFISRQRLLVETLARLMPPDRRWSVKVLDHDDPHLLDLAVAAAPAVVVVDVDTQFLPAAALLSRLSVLLPAAGVLVLGDLGGEATAEAMARGAKGCLTYSATPAEVFAAVESAAAGRTTVSSTALRELLGRCGMAAQGTVLPTNHWQLSTRELDILRLLAVGRSTAAIAADLGISVQTVRKHTQNILAKLDVHSKLAAAAAAAREGLV